MLYHIRKAHQAGILEKYYSDYDGSLVIVKKHSTQKIWLMSVWNKSTQLILTTTSMAALTDTIL